MFWHALQLGMSNNLELVFYLLYIVFLRIMVVNNSIMNMEISMIPWLPNTHQLKLLMLRWCSCSGCSREHIAVVLASEGCQSVMNGCLQPIGKWITQDSKWKSIDAPLTLILRTRQRAWRLSFSHSRPPMSDKWRSTPNRNINYPRCEAKNSWCSVDAHSQDAAGSMSLWVFPVKAANMC